MIRAIILLASALLFSANLSAQHPLIPFGSPWKYYDQGKDPGALWQQPAFADSAWKTGLAILGYGNLNETTLVSYGPDATRKYTTTYFRKTFTLADASLFASFAASIKRDDGAVVYVNGVEVYRSNLPEGAITYATLASVADDDGRTAQPFPIDTALLHPGTNVIAVEMHQTSLTNPDLAFDLELTGKPKDPETDLIPVQGLLIPFYATWEFLDNGSDQGTDWRTPVMGGKAWKTGPAILGYGNLNEGTVVGFGPDPRKKYTTTYFRKAVYLADLSAFSSFTANIKRDDGAVVYVNGVEVYRSNLPGGPVTHTTLAQVAEDDGRILQSFRIDTAAFQDGVNYVAVEVHQTSLTNGDLAFDLELIGRPAGLPADRTPPAVLSMIRQAPATQTTHAASVSFRVNFTEPVLEVDAKDFQLVLDGTVSGTIQGIRPYGTYGTSYDILIQSIAGQGSLGLALQAAGTGITDAAGNAVRGGFGDGQRYTVQRAPAPVALTRGPYLQMGSQSAVTLRWRTDKVSDSQLEVGTSFGTYPLRVRDTTRTTEHELRISGLQAGTRYYYRFGSTTHVLQADADNYFVTAPPANNPNKVRIAVFGDCGMNSDEIQSNALNAYRTYAGHNPAELLLLLGDNAYDDGTDAEYQAHFFDAYANTLLKNHVLFPTPGNHDYHTTSKAARNAPYYRIFSLPTQGQSGGLASGTEAYYSYDWGDVHFISLDSYGTESPDNSRLYDTLGAQVTWLKKDLAANTRPWVIVYWHHPPYSMGNHNSDTEEELILIRQNFIRILERHGVDLVLTGHSHNYERSYLLRNYFGKEASFDAGLHTASSASGRYGGQAGACPFVTSPGKTNHGIVYVVSGSSGQTGKLQASWPHQAMPFSDNEGGMLYLEVEQNRLDAKYLRTDGMVWDQFTIMKDVNKVTPVQAGAGDTVQLTASWIGTYRWSTGDTTRSIRVSPGQPTRYQVTDRQQCLQDVFQISPPVAKVIALRRGAAQESTSQQPWIYPALVSRGTRIRLQGAEQKRLQATVIDMAGRQLYEAAFTGTVDLETNSLPAGMYLIRLHGAFYRKTLKVLVKE